jgi:methanogenic corrinoid protein MtbC1
MAEKRGTSTLLNGSASLVDGLARSVITKVSSTPHQRRFRRIEIATKILYAAVTDRQSFDRDQLKADLGALRVTRTDIIDQCIPHVAHSLGEDWVTDRMSFALVTSASARLYGLCKSIGQDWDNIRPALNARAVMLATLDRESHIIGPAVLADQLRRRGHSVHMHSNASADSICKKISLEQFDGVLLSISTLQALESAAKVIREIRKIRNAPLIVLGGAVLNEDGIDVSRTGADMTTNDIDAALDAMMFDEIKLRVAE